jgi:hypothetical protein
MVQVVSALCLSKNVLYNVFALKKINFLFRPEEDKCRSDRFVYVYLS